MIGSRKPVSDAGDDMRSETVGLGRDLESNKVSVLWKVRWMVVLVEVAEGQRPSARLVVGCCRTRGTEGTARLAPEVEHNNRCALLTPSLASSNLERRKEDTGHSFISSTNRSANCIIGMTLNDPSCSAPAR
jgi:hypothetical protein